MLAFYKNDKYSDITITIEGEVFPCHKIILDQSEYFKTLLSSGMKETINNNIELKEISPKNFEVILKYLYGYTKFSIHDTPIKNSCFQNIMDYKLEDIKSIIHTSHLLSLDKLCYQCSFTAVMHCDIKNIPDLFNWMNKYDDLGFKTKLHFQSKFKCFKIKSWDNLYNAVDILDRQKYTLDEKKYDKFYEHVVIDCNKYIKKVTTDNFSEYITHEHFNTISANMKKDLLRLYVLRVKRKRLINDIIFSTE